MTHPMHVVFDGPAMVATGRGNREASRLIRQADVDRTCRLYAPTCALVEADRVRPGTAEHIASLPMFTIVKLDLPAALHLARDTSWAHAHTRHAASPHFERPDGACIATMVPDRWSGEEVRILDLRQPGT
jgi:hypothetical protein